MACSRPRPTATPKAGHASSFAPGHRKSPRPRTGLAPAVLELGYDDERGLASEVLELELRVPFAGMTDAHTGRATSETSTPVEGPRQPTGDPG